MQVSSPAAAGDQQRGRAPRIIDRPEVRSGIERGRRAEGARIVQGALC